MKAKFFIYSILILWLPAPVFSQTIYQLQYQLNPGENIKTRALFVLNDPGRGFVRLKFLSPADSLDVIVEMKIEEQFVTGTNGETDTNQLFYKSSNAKLIKGNFKQAILPVDFWFKINPQTNQLEPAFAKSTDNNGKEISASFLNAALVKTDELNKELVAAYFNESEPFYVNLFKTTTRALTALEKKTKIYLLIVANTGDSAIGIPCKNSMNLIEETFTNIAENIGLKIQVKKIFGEKYSKANVEKEISSLKPIITPNDVMIFYYVGHGFRKTKDNRPFPYIDLRANPKEKVLAQAMNAEDVFAKIKPLNARLNLLMTDCCNSYIDAPVPIVSADPRPRASGKILNIEKCRALFLNPKRMTLQLAAADIGQYASCNVELGAFFSFYFKAAMENALSDVKTTTPSWYQVIDEAKVQTINKARRTYCEKPNIPANICKQSPFYQVQ